MRMSIVVMPMLLFFATIIVVSGERTKSQDLPNVLLVLTDDQDLRLGSMVALPFVRGEILNSNTGVNMSNFFVNTPICCPSRATLLSGRYFHNNKVETSGSDENACMRTNTSRSENPAFWQSGLISTLHNKFGYTTGVFGKMLNRMETYGCLGKGWVPPEIDRGFFMCDPDYYNVTWGNFSHGRGSVVTTGDRPEEYTTSLVGNATLQWLKQVVGEDNSKRSRVPFFAFVGPHAPHLPATPPPYAVDPSLSHIRAPRDPIYGTLAQDKHAFISTEPPIDDADAMAIEDEHTRRLQSLVSVDDIVRDVVTFLRDAGEWERTIFLFTSDHGYNLGQNRITSHKTQVYDHNLRVPFVVSMPSGAGGGNERKSGGHISSSVASMVDVAPTLLELCCGHSDASMDGVSFANALRRELPRQSDARAVLVEYQSIRTTDTLDDACASKSALSRHLSAFGYRETKSEICDENRREKNVHIHDGPNNTFSAIRVLNPDNGVDLLYAEFCDVNDPLAWNFAPDRLNYFELYNVSEDYYMARNIYEESSAPLKASLHERLQRAIKCRGAEACSKALAYSATTSSASSVTTTASTKPPNFVLIFIDDTGWGDYSFNDPKRSDTPNLQRLANAGLVLTDFHAAASVCTPSRASLLTGRLGVRTGVVSNFGPFSKAGLPINETTIAELLKSRGYATAMAGKWHLGHRAPHSPTHRGFDAFMGTPMSHDYGCTNQALYDISCPNRASDVCGGNSDEADGSVCHIGPNNPWNESIPLYRDDNIVEQPVDLRSLSDRYVDFAIDFVRKATDEDQPFFAYMAMNHMHVPIGNHLPHFANASVDRGVYGDTLLQLDDSLGRLFDFLKSNGHDESTLIVVTGDNGAPSDQCQYGGLNDPFIGAYLGRAYNGAGGTGKTTTFEGGHREPGLAHWTGAVTPGRSDVTVSALDIVPTFCALAGVNLPKYRMFDGVDLSPLLLGRTKELPTARPHGNGALYHPNSGCEGNIGAIETLRLRNFKVKWRTGGKCTSCDGRTAPDVHHDPPLVFDLSVDAAESSPLPLNADESEYRNHPGLLAEIRAALAAMLHSITMDNTTSADYSQDPAGKPCCDPTHPLCMCADSAAVVAAAESATTTSPSVSARPNIFFLLTDDQDVVLGGVDQMKQLHELVSDKGTTFSRAFAHTPICCPSRSSFLTGRYLHNSLTFQNSIASGCGNDTWAAEPERRTYAVHAKEAGYATFYAGKYLNTYAKVGSPGCETDNAPGCFAHVPPGWDDWHGLQGNSRYYNGTISDNGVPTVLGDAPEDYLPDVFFGHLKTFLERHLAAVKRGGNDEAVTTTRQPFLAVLATPSCHGPFTPAAKYEGRFANASALRTPNWNASNEDKQWLMRQQAPLTDRLAQQIDETHNARWETMLSVDDYVAEVVAMLSRANELENTFIFYTSDHGFQLGQHRLATDKRHLYEHDIRIPLVVSGPGVTANRTLSSIVLNVDLAPTFVDIMGLAVPSDMDGRSFLPLLVGDEDESDMQWRRDFLVDYHGAGNPECGLQFCPAPVPSVFHENDALNNTYACVRTIDTRGGGSDSMYCEFVDDEKFVEYYDMRDDPWQMRNLYPGNTPPGTAAALSGRLGVLRACRGSGCW